MNYPGDNDMPDKILKRLVSIITEDHILKEFSLIPTSCLEVDRNVCPVRYASEEHCIGLETWCVKHVFKFAQEQIIKFRRTHKKPCRNTAETLNVYLTGMLLIQPEITTFWNIKRELLTSGTIDADMEFRFSGLVLSHKCKSYEAFTYRRWLINKLRPFNMDKASESLYYRDVLNRELDVLRQATLNTPNNYHAWNHRIWCFENITLPFLPLGAQLSELEFSEKYMLSHVSEHTGFHYRQYILNRFKDRICLPNELLSSLNVFSIDNNSNVINSMLDSEYLDKFEENNVQLYNQYLSLLLYELFKVLPTFHVNFPGHESIWYHRRFVISHIYFAIREIYGIKDRPEVKIQLHTLPVDVNILEKAVNLQSVQDNKLSLVALQSSYLYKLLLVKEKEFLEGLLLNNQWNGGDADLTYKYKKWLECILNVNI